MSQSIELRAGWQSTTLVEAYERWLAAAPRKHSVVRSSNGYLRAFVRAGLCTLGDVTLEAVVKFQAERLANNLCVRGVRNYVSALRSILGRMVVERCYPEPLLQEIRRVAVPLGKSPGRFTAKFLSRDQYEALVEAAERVCPRLVLPIAVAALAGPRVGELSRLRREDWLPDLSRIRTRREHWQDGTLRITDLSGEWGEAGSAKTGERTVPVCDELAEILHRRAPKSGWLFPSGTLYGRRGPVPKLPFLSRNTLETELAKVRTAAQLPDWVTWIVLRHTRASWWIAGDVSIALVANWLGHSVTTTERHYAGLKDGFDGACNGSPWARLSGPVRS